MIQGVAQNFPRIALDHRDCHHSTNYFPTVPKSPIFGEANSLGFGGTLRKLASSKFSLRVERLQKPGGMPMWIITLVGMYGSVFKCGVLVQRLQVATYNIPKPLC